MATSTGAELPGSAPQSLGSTGSGTEGGGPPHSYFRSRRVLKDEVVKLPSHKKVPKERLENWLPILGIIIGLSICGYLIYNGISSVPHHQYCVILDDDFSSGYNHDVWTEEIQVGGYGTGEFEQTTASDENIFVRDGNLFIKATLQNETLMTQNSVIDLLKDGTCTSKNASDCVAVTNITAGNSSVVNPVKSARIRTRDKISLTYGRIEVTAKLAKGDWLWPAIWMMPVNETYGTWPASGEIDIAEARGNNDESYPMGGNNRISSTIHYGPGAGSGMDGYRYSLGSYTAHQSNFADGFHTFGIEWTQQYIYTYVDSRLRHVSYTNFNQSNWDLGKFSATTEESLNVKNLWNATGRLSTPFDHSFYLILSLAVGSTNGYFADGTAGKPWHNAQPKSAKKDFWDARDSWFPTWDQPYMEIERVLMMQQCDGDEGL